MAQASYLECYPYKKCITQSRKEREEDDEQEHEVEIRNASHDSAHRRKSTKTMVPACAKSMHGDAQLRAKPTLETSRSMTPSTSTDE